MRVAVTPLIHRAAGETFTLFSLISQSSHHYSEATGQLEIIIRSQTHIKTVSVLTRNCYQVQFAEAGSFHRQALIPLQFKGAN